MRQHSVLAVLRRRLLFGPDVAEDDVGDPGDSPSALGMRAVSMIIRHIRQASLLSGGRAGIVAYAPGFPTANSCQISSIDNPGQTGWPYDECDRMWKFR